MTDAPLHRMTSVMTTRASAREMRSAFRIVRFPRERIIVLDLLSASAGRHTVHGLMEVDVSRAREAFRRHESASGETPSMTAWVVACVAAAARSEPAVRTLRARRSQAVFEHVDLSVVLERKLGDALVPLPCILRAADRMSFRQIHHVIRRAQAQPIENAGDLARMRWIGALPSFARRGLMRVARLKASSLARLAVPIVVTSVGAAVGKGAGWGVPIAPVTLSVTLGGIVERVQIGAEGPVSREHLCITLSFDHDVVDGSPAARFGARFRELVEAEPDFMN
jgi:pyruvate/2-oxoglutarate dehydrogenase complex dihydrolipoamide acyltransferase (E2) component